VISGASSYIPFEETLMPPTISTELLDALKEAGVSEEKARAAAAAVFLPDRRFDEMHNHFEKRFVEVHERWERMDSRLVVVNERLGKIETELTLHRWAFGVMLAFQAAILIKLLI
jgi:hypothetical protein